MIRPATRKDIWAIRRLVFGAKLDPTQLRVEQFWVIKNGGKIIACGQLRNFADAQELGSLVVAKTWRGQGLGTKLTQHLIAQATKPLYLECLGTSLAQFYHHLGFVEIAPEEVPRSLRFKFGLSRLGKILFRLPVMQMRHCKTQITSRGTNAK
ncbi:MAG: GNAT family N-acetyltransferase [Cyanobacteriota bacterium]|nr:GNAT family N-acetyltransferase [Cyanobacteriota bacterium]